MADEPKTFTQEQVDAMVKDQLAAAKSDGDKAFQSLWDEAKEAKKALKDSQSEFTKLNDKLTALEQAQSADKAGIDPDKLQEMRLEIEGNVEKKYEGLKGERDELAANVHRLTFDNVLKGQMGKGGARAERIDLLFKASSDHFELTEDGAIEVVVPGARGKDVDKYIAEDLAKEYPELFQGSGSNGGGASRSEGGALGATEVARGDNDAFLASVDSIAKGETTVAG